MVFRLSFLLLFVALGAKADDFQTHEIKLKDKSVFRFEAPAAWGNRPEVQHGDELTEIRFVPLGTRREPVFAVTLVATVPPDKPTKENVRKVAEGIRDRFRETALEDDIAIQERPDSPNIAYYFTITDKDINPREYQYLTTAVVSDGVGVVSCYFFSNDGAPDYAADALHIMDSVQLVPRK